MADGNEELRKMRSQLVELEKVCVCCVQCGYGGGGEGGDLKLTRIMYVCSNTHICIYD